MPGAPETSWGVWGEPEPMKAWEQGAPKLHGEIGGNINPQFSETLKWFYQRAQNPKDKEHCLRLLAQIELKQEDRSKLGKVTFKPVDTKRPISAKVPSTTLGTQPIQQRPKSAFGEKTKRICDSPSVPAKVENPEFTSYQKQQHSINRLSRPRTAKQSTIKTFNTEARPKSAMATVGRKRFDDPYLTTHEREFPGYTTGMSATARRPMSSKGFTAPYKLSDPVGGTTCNQEFYWKESTKIEPIRSGTSSGNRRNNPHPHESFMIWKLPNKSAKGMITATAPHLGYRELSNKVLDQILRDQLKTTYQNDYLGIPQGYQVKTAIDAPADWRTKIRRPLDTTVRYSYVRPQQHSELVGNTTRYGCNKKKGVAALGAVPTVTSNHVKNQEVIKGKTTYDTEFRNRYSQPDLKKLLENQTNKNVMNQFMRYSNTVSVPNKNTATDTARMGSASSQQGPRWLSKWEGPHHHEHQ